MKETRENMVEFNERKKTKKNSVNSMRGRNKIYWLIP